MKIALLILLVIMNLMVLFGPEGLPTFAPYINKTFLTLSLGFFTKFLRKKTRIELYFASFLISNFNLSEKTIFFKSSAFFLLKIYE